MPHELNADNRSASRFSLKELLLQYGIACFCLIVISFLFAAVLNYFRVDNAVATTRTLMTENAILDSLDLSPMTPLMKGLDANVGADADRLIAKASMDILALKAGSSVQQEDARFLLHYARQQRPTDFHSLGPKVVLNDATNTDFSDSLEDIRQALIMAPYEKETELLVIPILIKHWRRYPDNIRKLAAPMLRTAMREATTKDAMIEAMKKYQLVTPFYRFSPNREITAQLRELEANFERPTI